MKFEYVVLLPLTMDRPTIIGDKVYPFVECRIEFGDYVSDPGVLKMYKQIRRLDDIR